MSIDMKKLLCMIAAGLLLAACHPSFDPASVRDAGAEEIARVEPPC